MIMETIFVYAGNFITGEVRRAEIQNNDDDIAMVITGFLGDLGSGSVVWEIYNSNQSENEREFEFNNLLSQSYTGFFGFCIVTKLECGFICGF